MAKIICCDACRSTDVECISEVKRDSHTTTEEGWFGPGGSWGIDYIHHCKVYKQYKCKACGYEFEELDRSY